jgi:rod shape-determining protein MreC
MAIYSIGRKRVIALLVLTSILLVTLDQRGNAVIDRSRSVFGLFLEPFDTAARAVSRPVVNAWNGVVNYDDLQRENEALRAEIDNQRGAEIEARAAILQYDELLSLSRLPGSGAYPSVTAAVQGAAPSNFQFTVEIDKGSIDGIRQGMPVVSSAGLVGKITEVFPNSSIVLLITDPDFAIGVKVLTPVEPNGTSDSPVDLPAGPLVPTPGPLIGTTTTSSTTSTSTSSTTSTTTTTTTSTTIPGGVPGVVDPAATGSATTTAPTSTSTTSTTPVTEIIRETGTLVGQGAGQPPVVRFTDNSSSAGRVTVGATVETAGGIRSIAPAGLPIGTVTSIETLTGSRELRVEVELATSDLSRLNFLRVLLYVPNVSGQ